MNKIVIAPDSFKGTMSSIKICQVVEEGIKNIFPKVNTIKIPVADGGEGTVDAFLTALGGKRIKTKVKGPLFDDVEAFYCILNDGETAVVEMAAASGLPLVQGVNNPCNTTTYGTGQLIRHALDHGCRRIIVGIGGSATNDGGVGMAAALGIKFLDESGQEIMLTGGGIGRLHNIDMLGRDKRLDTVEIIVACDVDNPLYGPNGAAHVFSPQKGADAEMVRLLDNNLRNYAEVVSKDLGIKIDDIPGSGAAGGLGAGLIAFTGGKLEPGISIILNMVNFDEVIKDADMIITGEGRIDGQSLRGKVPAGIAQRALKAKVPVVAIVGSIGHDIEGLYNMGISAVFSINRQPQTFDEAKHNSVSNLLKTTEDIMRFAAAIA